MNMLVLFSWRNLRWLWTACTEFLNFAKSYILSCLSKFYNKKKFHRAVFEICVLKAEIKGVFSRS